MSDWIEEQITDIETEKFNDYLDLFEFNGFNPPKFWFGDRVKCFGDEKRTGVILGLEWRDGEKLLARGGSQNAGWWCQVCLDGRQSLMGYHENDLERIGEQAALISSSSPTVKKIKHSPSAAVFGQCKCSDCEVNPSW